MRRLRTLLHLATALLLTLQMARGGVDLLVCLHEDSVHLTSAHPDCCGDECAGDATPSDRPALGHDDCDCLDIPLPGHDHATAAPAPTNAAPDIPLLPLPETAAPVNAFAVAPAPPPSPPCSSSLQPLLRRSVELRI